MPSFSPSTLADALASAGPQAGIVRTLALELDARQPPWSGSGLTVKTGQHYSVFASGRIEWSQRHPGLHGGPRFHLWARVSPGGRIVNLRQDTDSFIADRSGELEFGIYMGMWKNAQGELASDPGIYARLRGALTLQVVVWEGTALAGVAQLAAAAPDVPAIAAELAHLADPAPPPAGWDYLVEAGQAEMYRPAQTPDGTNTIHICGEDDQGILIRNVDFPLTPSTRLDWRWRVDTHPSTVPEDTPHTHDYLSIAAEFEDGRDLTWIWSSSLPVGHHFACPIKAWSARETHWVARSGPADFGRMVSESREVYADVAEALGPPPARIVRIWLIVVATFQHGRFDAEVADICLHDGERRLQVL